MRIDPKTILVLKVSTFCVLIGRAYQHIIWDAPYRAFFWEPKLLEGIVESIFGLSWHSYVTNLSVSNGIATFIQTIGVLYLISAILVWFLKPKLKTLAKFVLIGSGISLILLAILYSKDKFFHVGQFFEYACQFMSPILLYWLVFSKVELKKIRLWALVAIALTFICHGLYAVGYYPRPGNFIDMTLNILPITEPAAHTLLKVAGILDFVVAIVIFIPKIAKPALIYAIIWGGLTAIARLVGHFYFDFLGITFNQWTWEVIIRLPHALIPLFVLLLNKSNAVKPKAVFSG